MLHKDRTMTKEYSQLCSDSSLIKYGLSRSIVPDLHANALAGHYKYCACSYQGNLKLCFFLFSSFI